MRDRPPSFIDGPREREFSVDARRCFIYAAIIAALSFTAYQKFFHDPESPPRPPITSVNLKDPAGDLQYKCFYSIARLACVDGFGDEWADQNCDSLNTELSVFIRNKDVRSISDVCNARVFKPVGLNGLVKFRCLSLHPQQLIERVSDDVRGVLTPEQLGLLSP